MAPRRPGEAKTKINAILEKARVGADAFVRPASEASVSPRRKFREGGRRHCASDECVRGYPDHYCPLRGIISSIGGLIPYVSAKLF